MSVEEYFAEAADRLQGGETIERIITDYPLAVRSSNLQSRLPPLFRPGHCPKTVLLRTSVLLSAPPNCAKSLKLGSWC